MFELLLEGLMGMSQAFQGRAENGRAWTGLQHTTGKVIFMEWLES